MKSLNSKSLNLKSLDSKELNLKSLNLSSSKYDEIFKSSNLSSKRVQEFESSNSQEYPVIVRIFLFILFLGVAGLVFYDMVFGNVVKMKIMRFVADMFPD
jgi:hypothetical protein